jgi:hypothetical protein
VSGCLVPELISWAGLVSERCVCVCCWPADEVDVGCLFSIELNERVYTLKVRIVME